MDVGVAILAVMPDVGEHRLDVTFGTCDRFVQAAQRILGLVVIEFRNSADRPPGVGCVAVLARDLEISVRAVCAACGLRPGAGGHPKKRHK